MSAKDFCDLIIERYKKANFGILDLPSDSYSYTYTFGNVTIIIICNRHNYFLSFKHVDFPYYTFEWPGDWNELASILNKTPSDSILKELSDYIFTGNSIAHKYGLK